MDVTDIIVEKSKVRQKAKDTVMEEGNHMVWQYPCDVGRTGNGRVFASYDEKNDDDEILNGRTRQDISVEMAISLASAQIRAVNMMVRIPSLSVLLMTITGGLKLVDITNIIHNILLLQLACILQTSHCKVGELSTMLNSKRCWSLGLMIDRLLLFRHMPLVIDFLTPGLQLSY